VVHEAVLGRHLVDYLAFVRQVCDPRGRHAVVLHFHRLLIYRKFLGLVRRSSQVFVGDEFIFAHLLCELSTAKIGDFALLVAGHCFLTFAEIALFLIERGCVGLFDD
jgi:hypothetical protein